MESNVQLIPAAEVSGTALSAFYEIAFPSRASMLSKHWRWQYGGFDSNNADRWPLIGVNKDGKVLGHVSTTPVRLMIDDIHYDGAWFVDFFVLPEARGLGVGGKLIRQVMKAAPVMLAIAVSRYSLSLFRNHGWVDVPGTTKMWLPLFPGNFPRFSTKTGYVLGNALNMMTASLASIRTIGASQNVIVSRASTSGLEEVLAASWSNSDNFYAIIRDWSYFLWRIDRNPLGGLFNIHRLDHDFALTRTFQQGEIKELNVLMMRSETPAAIFAHLVRWGLSERITRISIVTSNEKIKSSAKKWFPFQRELPPFFYSESKAAIRCLEKNHHCWELIDSDLDLSQAEYSP